MMEKTLPNRHGFFGWGRKYPFSSAPGLWALGSSAAGGVELWLAPVYFLLTGDPHAELLWADINGELQNVPQLSFPKTFLFSFFLCNMKSNQKLWVEFPPSFFTTERSWHHLLHTFVTQKITSHQVPVSLASFLGMTNSCVMQ